ncbi:MAG: BTAD domain-containing putative transcriptional regulator [Gemmatimonadota bacterium]
MYVKFLGGVSVPLSGRAAQRHRIALLALLAVNRSRGLSRDRLIGCLWPETSQERARHLLSDAIYRVNHAAGADVIVCSGEEVRLDAQLAGSDVESFENAFDSADYETAITLYGGALLDGFFLPNSEPFELWLTAERERLRRRYAGALERATDRALERQDRMRAVEYLRALQQSDPFSSRITLRLMTVLADIGDRAAALQIAREHEQLLKFELAVHLPHEIVSFVEELKSPAVPATLPPSPSPQPKPDVEQITTIREEQVFVILKPPVPQRWWRHGRLGLAAGLALAIVIVAGFLVQRSVHGDAVQPSIAVLPLTDLSNGDHAYVADGMTEELINALSRVPQLRVAARTSAFAYRNHSADIRDIADKLNVGTVLEGSLRVANGRIKVSVQLINARNGYEIWSDSYERAEHDVLAVQEDIARNIVEKLKGELLPAEAAAIAAIDVVPRAHNLYLRGRYHWHRRNQRDLEQAIGYFESALALAPHYARAWAGLADAYAICGFYDYLPPRTAFSRAREAARHALELDARSAAAHATLGYAALYFDWNFPAAEEHFRQSIALDPAYSTAHQWYGNLLTAAGRFAEADREMRRAAELDPLSLIANAAIGWTLYFARDYSAANDQLLHTLELDSTFQLAHLWRAWTLEEMQQPSAMQSSLQRAVRLSGGSNINVAALARWHALVGDTAAARRLLRQLEAGQYAPAYELAKVDLALNDHDSALDRLERAAEDRAHSIAFVHVDPQLDPLRQYSRFIAVAQQVRR